MREWSTVIHPLFIQIADIDKLDEIKKKQEKLIRKDTELYLKRGGKKDDYKVPLRLRIWVVFDDVGYKKKFCWSELVNEFACNHRHLGISIIFLCQYFNQLPPGVRDQLDYIAMLNTSNDDNIKKVYSTYVGASVVPKRKTFSMLLQAATPGPGKALWIDNGATKQTGEASGKLFYLEVPFPADYHVVGTPDMLHSADRHYTRYMTERLPSIVSKEDDSKTDAIATERIVEEQPRYAYRHVPRHVQVADREDDEFPSPRQQVSYRTQKYNDPPLPKRYTDQLDVQDLRSFAQERHIVAGRPGGDQIFIKRVGHRPPKMPARGRY